jgi:hypothetical protein
MNIQIQQELRDLAQRLDAGVGRPPFDYEGYRALIDDHCKGQTDEEIQREIEGIRRMTPDHTWPDWRGRLI